MPILYSHLYSSTGTGPWWGVRVSRTFYADQVRRLEDATRCFVYLVNHEGESVVVAVEGPHNEAHDVVFVPTWILKRLGLEESAEVMINPVLEALPKGVTVKIKPLRGSSIEGPIFVEGLTEALNQLGVVQKGLLTAVIDPSTGDYHEFLVNDLVPASVCLADGELTVDLEEAVDRPPTPPSLERYVEPESKFEETDSMKILAAANPQNGFVPFGGAGYSLLGGDLSHSLPLRRRLGRGEHPLLQRIQAQEHLSKSDT